VDFKMEPIAPGLEQVVVVGYGTQKRRDVTGAVATISSEDLNQGPITNPLQQISGKAAGVHVNQVGGEPGSAPNVRIRGISSLIGGNDPLVVIDGVQGNMDLLNQLPPSEIESRSEEHTSELQSRENLVCRLLLEKKKKKENTEL